MASWDTFTLRIWPLSLRGFSTTQSGRFALAALTLLPLASGASAEGQSAMCQAPDRSLRPILSTHTLPYPPISSRLGEQGVTVVAVTVGSDGAPTDVIVKQTSCVERLDGAAEYYLKAHWRWQPLTAGCKAATATVNVVWKIVDAPVPENGLTMLEGVETITVYTPLHKIKKMIGVPSVRN